MILIFLLLLAAFQASMVDYLYNNPTYYQLDSLTWETEAFRAMELGELVCGEDELDLDALTALMVENSYDLRNIDSLSCDSRRLKAAKPAEYEKLKDAYEMIFGDLEYFPIPINQAAGAPDISYEDSWGDGRTYGGDRRHEGCDVMGDGMPRGFYPVVSMSGGTVEKVGWLEQGGWRIGVRSRSGAYLYYAHLYSYSRDWKEGDEVRPGELLGFMGDSGYGAQEGTVGNFPVHLHVGIYLKTDNYEELSVNPYWVLRYLEKRRLKANFT
ncbi:MAG TPA: M23 family metallopeptidase [Candidatus Lachnoclostridium avicola]|nr:M23 family metallopeptidase [Candidatus Lachnoclostridium avicola]